MAAVTPHEVTARAEALRNRDTGLRVIVLEADPKWDDQEAYAIKANGCWAEYTYATAGALLTETAKNAQEA